MPRPAALLFDLDGTLVDSAELILSSFRHAFETTIGRVPPEDDLIAGLGTPLVTQFAAYAADDGQLDALVAAYRGYQREHHDRLVRRFDRMRETLDILRERGHPMGVVTSKIVELAKRALVYTELDHAIDVIVGCDSCQRHKPDPEPVEIALREMGYAKSEAAFIGDSPHDVAAGKAAGVVTIGVLWGPFTRAQLQAAQPDHLLERIEELPALVEQLFEGGCAAARVQTF